MISTSAKYTLDLPAADAPLLRSLAKKFGWTARKQKSTAHCRLDSALKDFEEGNTQTFDSVDDLMTYLNK